MSDYGLDTWYTGDNPEVEDGTLWPKELLPQDVQNSRIMSFGYDSSITHSDTAEVTQGSLDNEARSLCSLLQEQRSSPEASCRPIIFVAHSLGGLVCAKVVILGERNANGDGVEAVAKRVKGLIFLDQNTLKILKEESRDLQELGAAFPEVIRKHNSTQDKIHIVFFFETLDTHGTRIVEQRSASYPGIGEILPIRGHHISICKFDSRDDDGYKAVKAKILQMIRGEIQDNCDNRGGVVFNNYDRVINQAAGDIHIGSQTNS
ncbi:hypothetical protein NM208_g1506 [Fusarium decemcellulare]|uniref:Uncharacterized protein n=1 Tax=Fusarium decemcellulare TaxID=57161 RepID=A0ACC1SW29_9HYPO|nr:hypothetical protein NM208_g1506 [Fusarium decemcellulare]